MQQFEQVDAPVLGAVLAPRMPATSGGKGKSAAAPAERPAAELSARRANGGVPVAAGRAEAKAKDRKPMLILPQPTESTVVLPRVPQRDESVPSTGNGQSTTYKSSTDVNGKGGSRLSVALDSGEDVG
jgi:hypothetical protein